MYTDVDAYLKRYENGKFLAMGKLCSTAACSYNIKNGKFKISIRGKVVFEEQLEELTEDNANNILMAVVRKALQGSKNLVCNKDLYRQFINMVIVGVRLKEIVHSDVYLIREGIIRTKLNVHFVEGKEHVDNDFGYTYAIIADDIKCEFSYASRTFKLIYGEYKQVLDHEMQNDFDPNIITEGFGFFKYALEKLSTRVQDVPNIDDVEDSLIQFLSETLKIGNEREIYSSLGKDSAYIDNLQSVRNRFIDIISVVDVYLNGFDISRAQASDGLSDAVYDLFEDMNSFKKCSLDYIVRATRKIIDSSKSTPIDNTSEAFTKSDLEKVPKSILQTGDIDMIMETLQKLK